MTWLSQLIQKVFSHIFIAQPLKWECSILMQRKLLESLGNLLPRKKVNIIKKAYIDDAEIRIFKYNSVKSNKLIIYLHGGGFAFGLMPLHRNIANILSNVTDAEVMLVDYPLSPEAKFPSAINTSFDSYLWALNQGYKPQNVFMAGDSAGGTLALSTLLKIKEKGIPMVGGISLISPWGNLCNNGETIFSNVNKGDILNKKWLDMAASHYVGDADMKDPLVSPLFGCFVGFPPLHIQVGSNELLLSDAKDLISKAERSKVETRLDIIDRASHDHYLYAGLFNSSNQAINKMGAFISGLSNKDIK